MKLFRKSSKSSRTTPSNEETTKATTQSHGPSLLVSSTSNASPSANTISHNYATTPARLASEKRAEVDFFSEIGNSWNRKTLLTLDGGGIRGLSSLFVLLQLMEEIKKIEYFKGVDCSAESPLFKSKPNPDYDKFRNEKMHNGAFRPCHYFDYIAGTSTGGIIAIMLGRLQWSVEETIDSYRTMWTTMASATSSHSLIPRGKEKSNNTQRLEESLRKILKTESAKLGSDPKMCRTFVLAVEKSDVGYHKPYLFRSYPFVENGSTDFNRNPRQDTECYRILDVCRATSATPSLKLEPIKGEDGLTIRPQSKFQDGSRWTVNPSLEAYREINSMHNDIENPILYMFSVGCGEPKPSRRSRGFLFRNSSLVLETSVEDVAVENMMYKKSMSSEFGYCRVTGPDFLPGLNEKECRSDTEGIETFRKIKEAVEECCKKHWEEIQSCANQLVELRHRRAKTSRWEEFAFGYKYVCAICRKESRTPNLPFQHRADFVDHLRQDHDKPPETDDFLPELQSIISQSRIID
ncbi:hypothetical protein BP6252_09606 [Coleophoma cylindrospora]|uniref:PNPLA domain-containing protein n=1 Tax=Coleophoma cylindrospora TaxID=1849047 RepID=A0A3D8QW99_9HELO|nr:hypothetical protein BP6252_09606 [Coleophoma cylindrospora]